MNDFIIVYNDTLCHHGVKGQKWGVRRYLYDKNGGAESQSANSYFGKERQRALAYDKKVRNYQSKQSVGKVGAKALLLGSSNARTYDMARAAGHGRVRSGLKSVFDINAGTIIGSIGGVAIGRVGASITNNRQARIAVQTLSTVGGTLIGDLVARTANKKGANISLQQRGLMRKQAKAGNSKRAKKSSNKK